MTEAHTDSISNRPPDYSGLNYIATCQQSLGAYEKVVHDYEQSCKASRNPDAGDLLSHTLAVAAVVSRASLFKVNCRYMLQGRTSPLRDVRENRRWPESGIPLNATPDMPPDFVPRAQLQLTACKAWRLIATAVQHQPQLLANKEVCQSLCGAFGNQYKRLLESHYLRTYAHVIEALDKAQTGRFIANANTAHLGHSMKEWAYAVAGQQTQQEMAAIGQVCQPFRLAQRANSVGKALQLSWGRTKAVL